MSRVSMSSLEVIAYLLNGAHIVWRQKVGPGSDTYRVYMPHDHEADEFVGRIAGSTIADLWKRGFLVCDHPCRTDDSGDCLYIIRLDKPKLPFFKLEVSGND